MPYCTKVTEHKLRIQVARKGGLSFWMLDFSTVDDDLLRASDMSIYMAYTTFNTYKHKEAPPGEEVIVAAMKQCILQGSFGHAALKKIVTNRWQSPVIPSQ